MPSHPHVPGCARLNVMRLNAARLNYYESLTFALVGGVDRSRNVRIEGASVQHVLNDQPDTASVRVHGFVPVAGQPFALYEGERSSAGQLFGGRILETTVLYESKKDNVAYDLQCIDPTWLLNRRRVLINYAHASASDIVRDLITRFAPGVTTTHVVANLPIIDAITFTNEVPATCLTAICERVGAYWYLDYSGDLHVFLSETPDAAPITDAAPRGSSGHTLSEDLSQVVTRVVARGGSGQAFVDVPIGATELPVTDDTWFSDAGGVAEAAAQRITYTGVRGRAQTGAIVGTLTTPTTPLTVALANGTGLASGTYQYAQTLSTASGETLPGPVKPVVVGGTAPTLVKTTARDSGRALTPTGMTPGGWYSWRIHVLFEGGGFALGPSTDYYQVLTSNEWDLYVGAPVTDPVTGHLYNPGLMASGPARIVQTVISRTVSNGAVWYGERSFTTEAIATTTGWISAANNWPDSELNDQVPYPTGPIATFNKVTVSGMTAAAGSFTGTKLYRTAVNAAPLKLLATNPVAPFVDTVADAALGATAPTTDTAGVPLSNDQVPVGAMSFPVSSTAPFTADGGWAEVGNLPVRYTGVGAGTLTGIPATGAGSITATFRHGAQVLNIARLIGVGGLTRAILAGDPVTLRLELDDAAAQAALGARLGGTAADGIVEEVFSDSRMTLPELLNYGTALLLDRKDPRLTLRFVTRDPSVQVGRLITVAIATPPISGTFRVQRIGFDEIAITGGLARTLARRTVEASNKLYTFADLLRRLRGREGGAA